MVELIRSETKAHVDRQLSHRLSVARMCRLLSVMRAEVYRKHSPRAARAESADVRREIMEVAAEMPCYGYRLGS